MPTTTRTRFVADSDTRVTMHTVDEWGTAITRDFFVPWDGGYVREDWANPRQVCEKLYDGGATLLWRRSKRFPTLAHLIRHEHRRAQAAWRREASRL